MSDPSALRGSRSPRRGRGVVVVLAAVGLSLAASPVFWRVSTQADFLRGDVEHLTVDETGRLQLGPQSDVIHETSAPFLWTAAHAGNTLWVGSGNDGRVFALPASAAPIVAFDAEELNIHAVAPLDDRTAYVASSPDGAVYRVSTDGTAPQVVFDPDEQYIWALALGPGRGAARDLYVGTGEPGRIYRVTASGDAALLYETGATHVLSLAISGTGELVAGTGAPGRVYRVSAEGRGFVVLDSAHAEIRALRPGPEGVVYAVGVTASAGRTAPPAATPEAGPAAASATTATVTTTTTVTVTATASGTSTASSPPPAGAAAGAVYRIAPDGIWDTVWASATDTPYDVAPPRTVDGADGLLVATGGEGKIYRVLEATSRVALLTRAPAQQVTGLARAADGSHYYVTSNPGKVHRLSAAMAAQGSFVSEVRDAGTVATWGALRWRALTPAGSAVRLYSRSGNTTEPNDTWSPWSEAYADARGSAITSPKARFLQWKAELSATDTTPSLLSVTTAYLPRNLTPEITTLTAHPPGVAFQQPFSGTDPPIAGLGVEAEARTPRVGADTQTLGREVYRRGLRTFVWTARDDNGDDLEFDVFYRSESDPTWHALARRLRVSVFTWDTTSTPDGTYFVRVEASDTPSNAPGTSRMGFEETAPFDIDNTAPVIRAGPSRTSGDTAVVPVEVEDAHSPVHRVEYSLDTERWQVVHPLDGIPDSQREQFEIVIDRDRLDRLVIRATDAIANTATASGTGR